MIRNFRKGNSVIQSSAASCLVGALLALGCSGAPEESSSQGDTTEDVQARVTRILEMRGFDTTGLVFTAEETVVVEDDIIIQIKDVLAWESANIEKGYFFGSVTAPATIHLVNEAANPISAAWQWAFFLAAGNWNEKTTNLFIGGFGAVPPGAKVITVRKASLSPPNTTTWARATFPSGGNPGPTITLNKDYFQPGACGGTSTSIENIPSNQALKVAIHEMGHTFGFAHPGDGSHIPFTANLQNDPNYSTVMRQGCVGGSVAGTMSPDDQASAFILGY